jgi:hypothetical protein
MRITFCWETASKTVFIRLESSATLARPEVDALIAAAAAQAKRLYRKPDRVS